MPGGNGAENDSGQVTSWPGPGGGGSCYAGTGVGRAYLGNSSFPAPDGGTETGHTGNGYARITPIN